MAKNLREVYQLKINLVGAKPPIWRRVLVSNKTDLAELHHIIQIAMGWEDYHLHEFIVGRTRYGVSDPEFGEDVMSETGARLDTLLKKDNDDMFYTYDFGDGWEHKIALEKILPYQADLKLPLCVTGKCCCPPEDVGGIWGYQHFLQVISDAKHPEHEEMLEWAGDDFDPERFDKDEVNEIFHGEEQ